MTTLDAQTYSDEFIMAAKAEVKGYLDDIARELTNKSPEAKTDGEGDEDNLDALFAPKKKW